MAVDKRYPHEVGVGYTIRTRSGRHDKVRAISIVFHCESDLDEVYKSDEPVSVVAVPDEG